MTDAGVNTATIGIEPADDHVVHPDQRGQYAHWRDQPKRRVTGDGERKPNHVGLARPPIAVENRRRALPIHIARTLNVSWYQILFRNETDSRDERSHFSKHGFAPQLLPLNVAYEVSCRAGGH